MQLKWNCNLSCWHHHHTSGIQIMNLDIYYFLSCACMWKQVGTDWILEITIKGRSTNFVLIFLTDIVNDQYVRPMDNMESGPGLSVPSPSERLIIREVFLCLRSMPKMLSSPSWAAKCKTEFPCRSRELTSAPAFSRSSTTSACFVITAKCKGVWKRQKEMTTGRWATDMLFHQNSFNKITSWVSNVFFFFSQKKVLCYWSVRCTLVCLFLLLNC